MNCLNYQPEERIESGKYLKNVFNSVFYFKSFLRTVYVMFHFSPMNDDKYNKKARL